MLLHFQLTCFMLQTCMINECVSPLAAVGVFEICYCFLVSCGHSFHLSLHKFLLQHKLSGTQDADTAHTAQTVCIFSVAFVHVLRALLVSDECKFSLGTAGGLIWINS